MKKVFAILSITLVTLASCSKEVNKPEIDNSTLFVQIQAIEEDGTVTHSNIVMVKK